MSILLLTCIKCNGLFHLNPNSRERANLCQTCKNTPADKIVKLCICTRCNTTIERRGTNHKYCKPCRILAEKERAKKAYRKQANNPSHQNKQQKQKHEEAL